jgi:hypothetical protein
MGKKLANQQQRHPRDRAALLEVRSGGVVDDMAAMSKRLSGRKPPGHNELGQHLGEISHIEYITIFTINQGGDEIDGGKDDMLQRIGELRSYTGEKT